MNADFYLDANIIVSLLYEEERSSLVRDGLGVVLAMDGVSLVTSQFAFIEATKALINSKSLSPKTASKRVHTALKSLELNGVPFRLVPTTMDASYTFDDFWTDVGENMNLYNPGWGDSIHCVIMKNNGLENILSVDAKDDFEIVPNLNLFHPAMIVGEEEA